MKLRIRLEQNLISVDNTVYSFRNIAPISNVAELDDIYARQYIRLMDFIAPIFVKIQSRDNLTCQISLQIA